MKKYITYKIMQKFDIIDKLKGLTLENNQNNGIYINIYLISFSSIDTGIHIIIHIINFLLIFQTKKKKY
jgi:hypothetical protein